MSSVDRIFKVKGSLMGLKWFFGSSGTFGSLATFGSSESSGSLAYLWVFNGTKGLSSLKHSKVHSNSV